MYILSFTKKGYILLAFYVRSQLKQNKAFIYQGNELRQKKIA